MINNIQIENYKSIKNLDLAMQPINILIGANGVGKSNFINFFKFLKDINDQNLQLHVADEGSSEDLLHFGSKVSDYIYGQLEFDKINRYSFKLLANQDNKLYFESEDTGFNKAMYGSKDWYQIKTKGGYNESTLNESRSAVNSYVRYYMSSFRVFHFHDTSKTSKMRKPAQINDNSFFREDASNLPAYLYWMKEKHPKYLKKIEILIKSIAPYFEGFNLQADRRNEEIIRLEWKEKGSDAYFNAKQLSDGTLRFIALSTLLLQPTPPEVIIIDEPELGLHPFAINKLAGLVKKASIKTQIIISTQSVNLVDNFEPEDIVTVDREVNQSVFKRQNSGELKEWLNEYSISDLWNKNIIGGRP